MKSDLEQLPMVGTVFLVILWWIYVFLALTVI
jgi:hypothetical protein